MPCLSQAKVAFAVEPLRSRLPYVGFHPPVKDGALRREMAYEGDKGNLRFPLDQPVPYPLIAKIVRVRGERERGEEQEA